MLWKTDSYDDGLRLLDWLRQKFPAAPAGYLGQLLRSGRIRCAGVPLDRETRLAAGMLIELPDSHKLQQLRAAAPACQILAESPSWVVAFKPAGLAVHRSKGHTDNLTDRLQAFYAGQGAPFRVAPAQRLDLGTSGPVLFGKGRKATGELGRLFIARQPDKLYLALVAGRPAAAGRLDEPLAIDGRQKAALSSYRTLRRWPGCSLLLVTLATGRKHQIRRQLAAAGHPVVGDLRYHGPEAGPGRLCLHQCRLGFRDPWTREQVAITAPLPAELRAWLRQLGPAEAVGYETDASMLE